MPHSARRDDEETAGTKECAGLMSGGAAGTNGRLDWGL